VTGDEIQFAAKLSALEHVIEVMLADQLARLTQDDAEAVCRDMINRHSQIRGGPIDVDDLSSLRRAASQALELLLERAEARSYELRWQERRGS
jgi:hypothetical protein